MTEDEGILFSVIVPCCNVGRYLQSLIDSLQRQTCENFECLLVYEESSDDTLEQCQRLVETDKRFQLFQCPPPRSGSPAVPRNRGLEHAKGEYILFVDGDDWLEVDALDHFARLLKLHGQVDLIAAAATEYHEADDGRLEPAQKHFNYLPEDDGRIFTGEEATLRIGRLHVLPFPAVWLSLHRREFLQRHQLTFIPSIIEEDEEWSPKVLFLAEKVLVADYAFYNYRKRIGSVTTSLKARDLHSMALALRSLFAFYAAHQDEASPAVVQVWQRSWLSLFFLIFFYPRNQRGISEQIRRAELRLLLADDGLENFKCFTRQAALPKRLAVPLILFGRWYTLPACLYFRLVYYPLVALRERWRGTSES